MKSEQDLHRFLDEFESALEQSAPAADVRNTLSAAQKLLTKLEALQDTVVLEDEISAVRGIVQRLGGLTSNRSNLGEMLKRSRAIVELEGFVEASLVDRAKDLIARAEATKVRSTGRGQLPRAVTAFCSECDERLIARGTGAQNWGTVRFRIRKHATEAHGGISPALKKRIIDLRGQLKAGSDREEFDSFVVETVGVAES